MWRRFGPVAANIIVDNDDRTHCRDACFLYVKPYRLSIADVHRLKKCGRGQAHVCKVQMHNVDADNAVHEIDKRIRWFHQEPKDLEGDHQHGRVVDFSEKSIDEYRNGEEWLKEFKYLC